MKKFFFYLLILLSFCVSCTKEPKIQEWSDEEWSEEIGFSYSENTEPGIYLDGNMLVDFTTAEFGLQDSGCNLTLKNGKSALVRVDFSNSGKMPGDINIRDITMTIVNQLPVPELYSPVYFLFENGRMVQNDVHAFHKVSLRELTINANYTGVTFSMCIVISGRKLAIVYRGPAIPNNFWG